MQAKNHERDAPPQGSFLLPQCSTPFPSYPNILNLNEHGQMAIFLYDSTLLLIFTVGLDKRRAITVSSMTISKMKTVASYF